MTNEHISLQEVYTPIHQLRITLKDIIPNQGD